jgi:hypothetical protein
MSYGGIGDSEWHYSCIDLFATFNPSSSASKTVSQYPTTKRISQVLIYLIKPFYY